MNSEQVAFYIEEQEKLAELMPISENRWDNTVLYTLSMAFDDLYAMPVGYGINDCDDQYVMEHTDELKAKYVAARPGEEVNDFLEERGFELVDKYYNTCIYKLR